MFGELRAALNIRARIIEALKEVKVDNEVKPGYKTTEFWLHVLVTVPQVVGMVIGASNPVVIALGAFAALGNAIYIASRTMVKNQAVDAAGIAAQAAADALKKAADASK